MSARTSIDESSLLPGGVSEQLARYPLLDAMIERRSRRFGKGMSLNGGPLAYRSLAPAQPLSLEEEAALAFAACGITGPALAELPYQSGDEKGASGPFRTVLAHQAHHLDLDFYERFYRAEVVSPTQRRHPSHMREDAP
jgi:hypothetical protein